jgi:cobalt transporter subunit CbtA
MAAFRRLVFAALCAGSLSGVFAAAAHQLATVPLILQAETDEKASVHAIAASHEHSTAWAPEDGAERTAYTLLADILTGIGFALLVGAGLALRVGQSDWRQGLFWGLAGFATFTIAPGLGLPPQLPGSETAPLLARQVWWLASVAATGCALGLIVFTTRARWAILGVILIVLPHLYGAPQPLEPIAVVPAAVAQRFIVTTTGVNFLFWIILGASMGYFYNRLQPQLDRAARAAA